MLAQRGGGTWLAYWKDIGNCSGVNLPSDNYSHHWTSPDINQGNFQMQNCSTGEGLNTNLAPSGKRWKSGGVGIGGLALLVDRVARRRRARKAAAARRVRGVRTTSLY